MLKNMPKFIRVCSRWQIVVVMLSIITITSPLFAGDKRKLNAVQDMVEYTLSQLTKSVEAISERNRWLTSQIEALRQQIPETKKQLAVLVGQRENLRSRNVKMTDLGQYEGVEVNVHQSKVERFNEAINVLKTEVAELERRFHAKQSEEENIKRGIQANELEINRLKRELGIQQEFSKPAHMLRLKNDETLAAYRSSQERIDKLELTLQNANKRYQQVAANMLAFESKQQLLKERINIIKDEMAGTLEEKRQLERHIEKVRRQEESMDPLIGEIAALERRQKELKDILAQAHQKMETNKIDLSVWGTEQVKLEDNLKIIEKEHYELERQITMLQSVPSGI